MGTLSKGAIFLHFYPPIARTCGFKRPQAFQSQSASRPEKEAKAQQGMVNKDSEKRAKPTRVPGPEPVPWRERPVPGSIGSLFAGIALAIFYSLPLKKNY